MLPIVCMSLVLVTAKDYTTGKPMSGMLAVCMIMAVSVQVHGGIRASTSLL